MSKKSDITVVENKRDNVRVSLKDTDDIVLLENQLVLLGMSGCAYGPAWQDIARKIERLKEMKKAKKKKRKKK